MKHAFITLLAAIYLTACATITPVPTATALPAPTIAITQTPVPTLTPTATPTPEATPGMVAGMDVTKYGFDAGELVQKGDEIVYAETGEVAAKEVNGVMRFVYGPELIKHLHKVAKLGEMRNGDPYKDQIFFDYFKDMCRRIKCNAGDDLIVRKQNGYIESWSQALVTSDNNQDLQNNELHDVTIWVEPPNYVYGRDHLIKIKVTQWVNPIKYD